MFFIMNIVGVLAFMGFATMGLWPVGLTAWLVCDVYGWRETKKNSVKRSA